MHGVRLLEKGVMTMSEHERYMAMTPEAACAAGRAGNRPIASLIVRDGAAHGLTHNLTYT